MNQIDYSVKKTTILFIGPLASDTSTIFVSSLSEALNEEYLAYFIPQISVNEELIRSADYCIFSRCFDSRSFYLMRYAKQLSKPVLYMLDDDLLGLYQLGPEFSYCAPGTPVFSGIVNHIGLADIVITFSDVVTQAIHFINRKVIEINPNILKKYLDRDSCSLKNENEPLRIIFSGSAGKRQVISLLWSTLQQFSLVMKDRIQFHFWGVDTTGFSPLVSPVIAQPTILNYPEYINRLSAGGFHIFLAPLDDTARCQKAKCCIKYLEATAAGGIGIYSDTYPYKKIADGLNGIKTPHTIDGWFNALSRAVHLTPSQRQEMWIRGKEDILNRFTTESQVDKFLHALNLAKHYSTLR